MKPRPSEAEFTRQVLALAKLLGWRTFHARAARTTKGWRTAVAGDGVGFPDLLLCRGDVLLVAELKTDTGRLTVEQSLWLAAFRKAGVDVRLWTPSQWQEIEEVLR